MLKILKSIAYLVLQFVIIGGCLLFGELVVWLTNIHFPSSIIGMLTLTVLLQYKIVKVKHVIRVANGLIDNLPLFFVVPGVAVMLYSNIIFDNFIAILISVVVSTILVMWSTGYTFSLITGKKKKFRFFSDSNDA